MYDDDDDGYSKHIQYLFCIGQCSKHFIYTNSFNFHNDPKDKYYYYNYFSEEEMKQGSLVTYPKLHTTSKF